MEPPHEIFTRFKMRVESRVESNKKLAEKNYDFKGDKNVELNRQKSPWPKDLAEADEIVDQFEDLRDSARIREFLVTRKTHA